MDRREFGKLLAIQAALLFIADCGGGAKTGVSMNFGIVSHSLLAPTAIHAICAPSIMVPCMPGVNVANWAVDGNTNFRQLNSGQNATIAAWRPDVLMLGLQINDVTPTGGVDNRTMAQVIADAGELFDWYKANIPGVKLIHLQEFGGRFATPDWVTFNQAVATQRKWDGYSIMNYENCVDAAALITNTPTIDAVDGFGHPSRITCHMQAAELLGGLLSWFGLPAQAAQWSNVETFMAAYKTNDPYALSAAKSLTT